MIPRLPDYGHGSLADLLPSIGARFGVPNAADVIGLPQAEGGDLAFKAFELNPLAGRDRAGEPAEVWVAPEQVIVTRD